MQKKKKIADPYTVVFVFEQFVNQEGCKYQYLNAF